jgi:hypothetical protein
MIAAVGVAMGKLSACRVDLNATMLLNRVGFWHAGCPAESKWVLED